MPQYVHLTGSKNENHFVDLAHCATVTKSALARSTRLSSGIDKDDSIAVGRFGVQIGRRFSRFAFPDEVQPWFRPLQEKVAKGYGKGSPLGRLLRETVDLRIQSNDWNTSGMHLVIHLIVPSSLVPSAEDFDPEDISRELIDQLRPNGELIEDASQIAARILTPSLEVRTSVPAPDRFYLWNAFAEALAQLCQPKIADLAPSIHEAVASVSGQLSTDEEFSLYLIRRTESLDLEHLSPPAPFAE